MASDWGGERVKDFAEEMVQEEDYKKILKNIQKQNTRLNYGLHYSFMDSGNRVCYAARENSVVIGSDGTLYKCTGDFTFEQNKVGKLSSAGELLFNDHYYLWLEGIHKTAEKCKTCFFGACCLSMYCPAVKVKGLDTDTCSFEKDNMGLFLELFGKEQFASI
jgi:uncharacterized protein